ncbi:WXG100-like domain-containing protein [Nocardia sp. NPDC003963]
MSIHIPSEVVFFLNVIGVPYPDIDVDQVRELANSAREFARDVQETFDAATGTLDEMGSALSGDSYQAILAGWAYQYDRLTELDDAFEIAATALDIAADVIETIQIAVLVELAALAASFIAGMFTPAGPVTGPMIAAAARYIAKEMAKAIMWYIAAEVVAKAVEPLAERFQRFIREALEPPPIPVAPGPGSGEYRLDPDEVERYSRVLDNHADDLMSHGAKFGEKLSELDFNTPGLGVEPADWSDDPLDTPGPVDNNPPSIDPNVPPGSSPVTQLPTTGAYPGHTPGTESSGPAGPRTEAPSDPRAGRGTDPTGATTPTSDPNRPAATAPETPAATTPGAVPSATGGVQASGTDLPGRDGSTSESRTTTPGTMGYGADRSGAEAAQHSAGSTAGMVPPGSAQASPTQASPAASGQSSQAAPASQGQRAAEAAGGKAQSGGSGGGGREAQRPADSGAGKGQSGAGRGPGSGPGAQQPAARAGSKKTPWSRAGGKAARVDSTTKRPDVEAPATSVRATADGGDAAKATPAASDAIQQNAPQVFAPETASPPPGPPIDTRTGDDRETSAEPPPKEDDVSAAGARPPSR